MSISCRPSSIVWMFFTRVFSWCSFSRCWSIGGNSSREGPTWWISLYCLFNRRVSFWSAETERLRGSSPEAPEPEARRARASTLAAAAATVREMRPGGSHSSSRLSTGGRMDTNGGGVNSRCRRQG